MIKPITIIPLGPARRLTRGMPGPATELNGRPMMSVLS
jgi:hypothetical protein